MIVLSLSLSVCVCVFMQDEGEELARMVGKLRMDRESEEDMRRQAEWEKDNLRKAKEMIEKELKLLVIENKT